ncbi:hypothetical protein SGLAM104S_07770 [Streptomyces glaucescens]
MPSLVVTRQNSPLSSSLPGPWVTRRMRWYSAVSSSSMRMLSPRALFHSSLVSSRTSSVVVPLRESTALYVPQHWSPVKCLSLLALAVSAAQVTKVRVMEPGW